MNMILLSSLCPHTKSFRYFWRLASFSSSRDYYAVLGVKSTASQDEIKAAYYAQSKLLHPDTNPHNDSAKFALLAEAYAVLGNASTRSIYDKGRRTCSRFENMEWVDEWVDGWWRDEGESRRIEAC